MEAKSSSERWIVKGRLGQGAFGDVRWGVDGQTGRKVALKYVRVAKHDGQNGVPKAIFREMEALKQLSDRTKVVELLDVYPEETTLCLVLEYLPSDLSEIIDHAKEFLPVGHIKAFAWMLLDALAYIHSNHVIHRDVKPSNVLLSADGQIKLADFGLARVIISHDKANGSLSHQVATRWYRPPELLFASRSYTFSADVWSAGVVIGELFALRPLFPGINDIDQMFRVFQVLGSPTPDVWPGVSELPDYNKVSFPDLAPIDFKLLLPHLAQEDLDFLLTLIRLDPASRATASSASRSLYFAAPPQPQEFLSDVIPLRRVELPAPTNNIPLGDKDSLQSVAAVEQMLLTGNEMVSDDDMTMDLSCYPSYLPC